MADKTGALENKEDGCEQCSFIDPNIQIIYPTRNLEISGGFEGPRELENAMLFYRPEPYLPNNNGSGAVFPHNFHLDHRF